MKVKHTLKPIYDNDSKILILGSMPSIKSRELNFYYANPTNRFWKIFEILFNTKLTTIEEKINFLHKNHIALFDVFKSVEIKKSSDSSIKNYTLNDLSPITSNNKINAIFITGKKAYETFIKNNSLDIKVFYLPSPSSANAKLNLNDLVNHYKIILDFL